MACSLLSLSPKVFHSPILFFLEYKWRLVYVLSGHELCSGILFTIVLAFVSAIMVDCYVVKLHYQLFFEGYRPPGYWKRHDLSVF
jgi:hypothetical protein